MIDRERERARGNAARRHMENIGYDRIHRLAGMIQEAETLAYDMGLTLTGKALNRAKNTAGWDAQGEHDLAAMAMRGERPGADYA